MTSRLRTTLLIVCAIFSAPGARGIEITPVVVRDHDNNELVERLSIQTGVNLGAVISSFAPEPITASTAEVVAMVANLNLKNTPPVLIQPADIAVEPNSSDQCSFDFDMPQSSWKYVNYLGLAVISPIPEDWGELGTPFVLHANTDVILTAVANNPNSIPQLADPPRVGLFPQDTPVNVRASFPAGRNTVHWRAEARLDPIMDVALPLVLFGVGAKTRYASTGTAAVSNASKTLTKTQLAKTLITDLLLEAAIFGAGEGLDLFDSNIPVVKQLLDGYPTAIHERTQKFTVFDVHPPQLTLGQSVFTVEATGLAGTPRDSFWDDLVAPTLSVSDDCGRTASVSDDAPFFLPVGETLIEITASDEGPKDASGLPNQVSDFIRIRVEDTQAPIIVAPPSRVVEVAAGTAGINPEDLMLGTPQVIDLADASPDIDNNGPAFYPLDSRANIVWRATDNSGNSATASQFVTVKTAGTNTAPTATDVSANTLTSQPVDIVLSGNDSDFLDGQLDPVSFEIETPPSRGEFVAPLLPYFIDDYRTQPDGPYGQAFLTTPNPNQWLFDNVCQAAVNPIAGEPRGRIVRDFPYEPLYIEVEDEGDYYLLDHYFVCRTNNADRERRISKWSSDGTYIGQIDTNDDYERFLLDDDGFIYQLSANGSGSSTTFRLTQCRSRFGELNGGHCGRTWRFDFNSAPGINPETLAYARVDVERGLLFMTDARRVFVFDVRDTPATLPGEPFRSFDPEHIGTLFDGERLIGALDPGNCGEVTPTIDFDSTGNLYVGDPCTRRVHKFLPTTFDADGELSIGEYVGWLGYCTSSTNNACDTNLQRSKGFSCTNDTCGVPGIRDVTGDQPGQFGSVSLLRIAPNGLLYVVDSLNLRIQRFTQDGTFVGQAVSSGTGINQGEQGSFILGNFGRPTNVSVNSDQFFVVDRALNLVHVFQTSPFKDITSNSATVTYVSDFDAHSIADSFTYRVSDGLASSNLATATVTISRNFRAPQALEDTVTTQEDTEVSLTLRGDDPDGIVGEDFNGLDTLTFRVVREPRFGSLTGTGAERIYTPRRNFEGEDFVLFVSNDGLEDSLPARIDINVTPVNDPPELLDLGLPQSWGRGFSVAFNGVFKNDGEATYNTSISWGDGSTSPLGDIVNDGSGDRVEGVTIIPPFAGRSDGRAMAEHTFLGSGSRTVQWCLSEDGGSDVCLSENISVLPLVRLDTNVIAVSDEVDQGATTTLAIQITNAQPMGYSGLPASDIRLVQLPGSTLEIVELSGAPNGCDISQGELNCRIATMLPGQTIAFTAMVRHTGPVYFDALTSFTISATNLTPAVNDESRASALINFNADLTDSDNDGLADGWERDFGLVVGSNDAQLDGDNDGLTNTQEFANRTRPDLADTDNDGIDDGTEVANNTNPLVTADSDGDGETNDTDSDDDNDGMPDTAELAAGLDPFSASDALEDADGDGVTNLAEVQAGTDPADPNSMPTAGSGGSLFASVLPLSRSVVVGDSASAFATILNDGDEEAIACSFSPRGVVDAQFSFRRTDPLTNAAVGELNPSVNLAAKSAQSFVFLLTPNSPLDEQIELQFICANRPAASSIAGINTFRLQGSSTPTADVIAISATETGGGIVDLASGIGAFALGSFNVGADETMIVRPRSDTDVILNICQTDTATGLCINPTVPAPFTEVFVANGATPSFGVFVSERSNVAFDPANNRVIVEFFDGNGTVRGGTSVAVRSLD